MEWPVLDLVRDPRERMRLTTIYRCGLRLSEGTHLTAHDIDGARRRARPRHERRPIPVRAGRVDVAHPARAA